MAWLSGLHIEQAAVRPQRDCGYLPHQRQIIRALRGGAEAGNAVMILKPPDIDGSFLVATTARLVLLNST
jgi:hypothetical protein